MPSALSLTIMLAVMFNLHVIITGTITPFRPPELKQTEIISQIKNSIIQAFLKMHFYKFND